MTFLSLALMAIFITTRTDHTNKVKNTESLLNIDYTVRHVKLLGGVYKILKSILVLCYYICTISEKRT